MENALIILLTVAISLIKFGQGLDLALQSIFIRKNSIIILRGVISAVFLVPLLFLLLIVYFQPIPALTYALLSDAMMPYVSTVIIIILATLSLKYIQKRQSR